MVLPTLHEQSKYSVRVYPPPSAPEWRRLVAWTFDACEVWLVMPLGGALIAAMVIQHC